MVGELVGSYKIIKLLGAGAMGQVYLAEHKYLKRQAALKVLARELVDRPDLLERFFLEARATSAIDHPGIVQIFDCEVDATGRPYIVMELLTGETLAQAIARQGVLSPLSAARLTRSLADALGAAHAKEIVHRDLKPENIFVQLDPPDSIKLVDFGIAKLAGEFQSQQMHKTRSGSVMGTPLYMSPEQCRDSANIDFRTDLYSVGCVFFEMLTGRPPFVRDNFGDLLVAHMLEPAPDPRTIVPTIPAPLAELVGELLSKDPTARPASARLVAERLMTYVARMTTVPGAAASAPVAARAPTAPSMAAPPPAGVRTTFGGSASEVATDDVLDTPARGKGPVIAGLALLLAGGVAAAVLALKGKAPVPSVPIVATPAPTMPPAPPPATAPPAPRVAPVAREAVHHLPAASAPAKREPKPEARPEKPARPTTASGGARREPTSPASVTGAPSEPPSAAPVEERHPSAAASSPLAGAWEGPWVDAANGQRGRLFLQVSAGGTVSGWMYNTSAKLSFRMAGTMKREGAVDLSCQCAADQAFSAKGSVSPDEDGDLKGDFALNSPSGTFGHARVTLRRNAVNPTAR